jgi:hypothetical protein
MQKRICRGRAVAVLLPADPRGIYKDGIQALFDRPLEYRMTGKVLSDIASQSHDFQPQRYVTHHCDETDETSD